MVSGVQVQGLRAMVSIVVFEHQFQANLPNGYLLYIFVTNWRTQGHHVVGHRGPGAAPKADLAIYNVDISELTDDYSALATLYPVSLNAKIKNIRKSSFSLNIVSKRDHWDGEVILKTDRNRGGLPERSLQSRADAAGVDLGLAQEPVLAMYKIYDRLADVPETVWHTPGLVVEKFKPEQDDRGFYLRMWTFFGDREHCNRFLSSEPMVRASNIIDIQPVPVPDVLREVRARLNFDFGRFDFVCHQGEVVLLDINKTPSAPSGSDLQRFEHLSQGLDPYINRL